MPDIAKADGVGRLDERMFVCRAVGRSMEPTIRDGDYIVFRAKPTGTRQGRIVLAQYQGPVDPDKAGAFTVKRYSSEKEASDDRSWRTHTGGAIADQSRLRADRASGQGCRECSPGGRDVHSAARNSVTSLPIGTGSRARPPKFRSLKWVSAVATCATTTTDVAVRTGRVLQLDAVLVQLMPAALDVVAQEVADLVCGEAGVDDIAPDAEGDRVTDDRPPAARSSRSRRRRRSGARPRAGRGIGLADGRLVAVGGAQGLRGPGKVAPACLSRIPKSGADRGLKQPMAVGSNDNR